MARESSRFFNSTDEDRRIYNATEFASYFSSFFSNGVIGGSDLKVVASSGMNVLIKLGRATISGYLYELQDDGSGQDLPLTLQIGDQLPRIDRVVLRLNLSSDVRLITAAVVKGTPASSPAAPALTRSGNIYEISLAKVSVPAGAGLISTGNITDERGDYAVCGYASGHGQPAYQPPGDISSLMWQYAMFPASLTAEQVAMVEGNSTLVAQYSASRLARSMSSSIAVNPFVNRVEIKTSQTWTAPAGVTRVGVVVVGGGGGGAGGAQYECGSGGGGGRFIFKQNVSVNPGQGYGITIGAGGTAGPGQGSGGKGGTTSAFGQSAVGGDGGRPPGLNGGGGSGGNGGGGGGNVGGAGGSDGSHGEMGHVSTAYTQIAGQALDAFTRDPYTMISYCGGGGGGGVSNPGTGGPGGLGGGGFGLGFNTSTYAGAGAANTGGGGGGGTMNSSAGASGGSGIVIIYY